MPIVQITDSKSGEVLLNTLIKPSTNNQILPEAEAIHGITPEMVQDAPVLSEIAPRIELEKAALPDATKVLSL